MKNYYEIEFYDFKEKIGRGACNPDKKYTNKKVAVKIAKEIYKNLCDNDKKHISVLVNKYDSKNNDFECVEEIKKEKSI